MIFCLRVRVRVCVRVHVKRYGKFEPKPTMQNRRMFLLIHLGSIARARTRINFIIVQIYCNQDK